MCARQLLFAAVNGSLVLLHLLLEFRNFQDREDLPLLHMGSIINIEFLDVAGNLGVHIDFLEGLELRGNLQIVRDVAASDFHDGGRWSVCPVIRGGLAAVAASDKGPGKNYEHKESRVSVRALHGISSKISHHGLRSCYAFS